MSIASRNVVPELWKTSIIQVQSYTNKNLQGVLYSPYWNVRLEFQNLTQLLFLMEEQMDHMKFPQKSTQDRCFGSNPQKEESVRLVRDTEREVMATFQVKVLFRQSASWQGKLFWSEGKQEIAFRSALELVKLMDSALSPSSMDHQERDDQARDVG